MKKEKTICAITGYRTGRIAAVKLEESMECMLLKQEMKKLMEYLIHEHGVNTFISGLSPFIEFYGAEIVLGLKNNGYSDLKLICVEECRDQMYYKCRTDSQMARYKKILEQCDRRIVQYENYIVGCEEEQKHYIACHSDMLIAVWPTHMGRGMTLLKDMRMEEKPIFYLDPQTRDISCGREGEVINKDKWNNM